MAEEINPLHSPSNLKLTPLYSLIEAMELAELKNSAPELDSNH